MLVLLALIAWVFGGTSGAAESKLAGGEIRALGSTRLSELGYVSTDVIRFPAMRTLSFDFPEDAAQGPRIWYVLHLHFEVVMAPDGDGVALVSAATNERTAAQIEVETHPGQPLTYSAIGLIGGKTQTVVDSRTADVRFSNYLQQQGARPGSAQFSISVDSLDRASVRGLTIFDDTAIQATTDSPYVLSLTPASTVTPTPVTGERFVVNYALGVQEGRPVGGVAVEASASDGLQIVGSRNQDVGQIVNSYNGHFAFVASEPGEYEVHLRAKSDANQPAATIRMRVVDSKVGGSSRLQLGAIGAAVAIVVACRSGRRRIRDGRRGRRLSG